MTFICKKFSYQRAFINIPFNNGKKLFQKKNKKNMYKYECINKKIIQIFKIFFDNLFFADNQSIIHYSYNIMKNKNSYTLILFILNIKFATKS